MKNQGQKIKSKRPQFNAIGDTINLKQLLNDTDWGQIITVNFLKWKPHQHSTVHPTVMWKSWSCFIGSEALADPIAASAEKNKNKTHISNKKALLNI